MRNAGVQVRGNIYQTNAEGVTTTDVKDEDSVVLLQNAAWQRVIERSPVTSGYVQVEGSVNDLATVTTVASTTDEPIVVNPDYQAMKKKDLITLLEYRKIKFDPTMKKVELIKLLNGE